MFGYWIENSDAPIITNCYLFGFHLFVLLMFSLLIRFIDVNFEYFHLIFIVNPPILISFKIALIILLLIFILLIILLLIFILLFVLLLIFILLIILYHYSRFKVRHPATYFVKLFNLFIIILHVVIIFIFLPQDP